MSNVPLEIIVTGNTDGANSALRKTQEELGRTAIAAQKTDSSLQKLGQDSGKSIFNLTEKLRGLESAVFTEKSVAKIANFNKQIEVTKGEIDKLSNAGKKGFNELGEAVAKTSNPFKSALASVFRLAYLLPGIGVAGILAFAIDPLTNFIKGLIGVETATHRAFGELNSVIKELGPVFAKVTTEVSDLRVELKKAEEGTISKKRAIDDYNKSIGAVTGQVKTLEQAEAGLNANANKYIQYTIAKAAANIALAKAADVAFQVIQLGIEEQQKLTEVKNIRESIFAPDKKGVEDAIEKSFAKRRAVLIQSLDNFKSIADQFKQAQASFNFDLATPEAKEVKPIKVKEVKIKPQKVTIDIGDATTGLEDAGADLADRLVRGVESEIEQRGARSSITERAGADFADAYINGAVAEFDSSGKDALKDSVDGFNKLLVQSIADIQIDALVGLGEAIGDALSGGQNVIPNLFGAIFNSVGTQIQNLGKYLIKAAIEVKAAKEAFAKIIGNFPLAIVAGVGLIALGAILKKQAQNQFPGFATGVRNFKGGTALVGERGPELVNLPQGSDVIPNRALQGTSAGGGNVFIAESVIRGTDLVTIFNRATAQNRRNG